MKPFPLKYGMANPSFPVDAFGDRFDLRELPLPRPPAGYAVQMLDTDTVLDRDSNTFLPIRSTALHGLFPSFDEAYSAARNWAEGNCPDPQEHRLAIVPAGFDTVLNRHVLIYGVLCGQP